MPTKLSCASPSICQTSSATKSRADHDAAVVRPSSPLSPATTNEPLKTAFRNESVEVGFNNMSCTCNVKSNMLWSLPAAHRLAGQLYSFSPSSKCRWGQPSVVFEPMQSFYKHDGLCGVGPSSEVVGLQGVQIAREVSPTSIYLTI